MADDPKGPTAEEVKLQKEMNALRKQLADVDDAILEKLAKANIEREKEKQISASTMQNLTGQIQMLAEINASEENRSVRLARQREIEELMEKSKHAQMELMLFTWMPRDIWDHLQLKARVL